MDNNQENIKKQAEEMQEQIEIDVAREEIKQEEIKAEGKVLYYIKTIFSGVIDQILAVGIALILFVVFDLILGAIGYEIIGRDEMFLIMYIITNVLYYPLSQEFLEGRTLGKRIMTR